MRLIDADAVCEECIEESILETCEGCVIKDFKLHKAVEAEPVIRCRDCKHWKKDVAGCTDFVGRCDLAKYMIGAAGYCLYGERRGDDA